MLKKMTIFSLIATTILIVGCSKNDDEISIIDDSNYSTNDTYAPLDIEVSDFEDLFMEIGEVRFKEDTPQNREDLEIINLKSLTELYKPSYFYGELSLSNISVYNDSGTVSYRYSDNISYATFIWKRKASIDLAMLDVEGRGEIGYKEISRNGINYIITEWEGNNFAVIWIESNQVFNATFPNFQGTEAEMLAFCIPQHITNWQLSGDAVSISIQGMADVNIIAHTDETSSPGDTGSNTTFNQVIADGEVLYLVDSANLSSGNTRSVASERIGYRWLIDEATSRYQYVLAPGTYEFRATGVIGEPELLVRHFESGETVLTTDFTTELSDPEVGQFSVTVTPEEVIDFTTEVAALVAVTGTATDVSTDSATLNGSIVSNSGTVEYGFYWGLTDNPSTKVVLGITDESLLNFAFDLKNLSPRTTYFFKTYAGEIEGSVQSFATKGFAITNADITVTAPVLGEAPIMTATATGNFTVSPASWLPADSAFAAHTRYTVYITLTANEGYTFEGLVNATVNGMTPRITSNTGDSVTIYYQFEAYRVPITAVDMGIRVPVTGEVQSIMPISGTGNFSRSHLTWSPNDQEFRANTRYTVSLTLTANDGYTFTGLANARVNGNPAAVSNNRGDSVMLSFEFPATESIGEPPVAPPHYYIELLNAYDGMEIAVGGGMDSSFQIEWRLFPENAVITGNAIFESSDTEVLDVDEMGWLSVANRGDATITVIVPTSEGNVYAHFSPSLIFLFEPGRR
jgi:hypothetical protein